MKNAIKFNPVLLSFSNLMGSSVNVFHEGNHVAHLRNNGGASLEFDPKYTEFSWIAGATLPCEPKEIISEFNSRRTENFRLESAYMNGGWTQWDPLEVESWEETNRDRLNEALAQHGLKITFEYLPNAGSTWFKITKA